jgi:hypothetical protein
MRRKRGGANRLINCRRAPPAKVLATRISMSHLAPLLEFNHVLDLFGSQTFICNGLEYRVPVLRKSGIDDGIAKCAMQKKAIANAQVERLDRARYRLERHWVFLITLN